MHGGSLLPMTPASLAAINPPAAAPPAIAVIAPAPSPPAAAAPPPTAAAVPAATAVPAPAPAAPPATTAPVAAPAAVAAFVDVAIAPDNCEPRTWTATSNSLFITFSTQTTSGLSTATGLGNGKQFFTLEQNPKGDAARTGSLTVAGQGVTVNQAAQCRYTYSPSVLMFPGSGGSAVLTINVSPSGCDTDTWTISAGGVTYFTLSATGGKGSGTVTITAAPYQFAPQVRTSNISVGPPGDNVPIPTIQQ